MPRMRTVQAQNPPTSPLRAEESSRRLMWIRVLLVLATLIVFSRTFTADFTNWDDPQTTFHNPYFESSSPDGILWFWWHPYMHIYAPLPFTVWGLLLPQAKVSSPNEIGVLYNSWIFHAVNILLHAAAVMVAFELLRRLIRHSGAAAIGALLFALHPVQVEPVAWISGLKDVLYGLFCLIALWQYVLFVQAGRADSQDAREGLSHPAVHYAGAVTALLLALFSKPTAVVTPLLAFVIDYWLLRSDLKKVLRRLWPWFVIVIPFVITAKLAQPASSVAHVSLWWRPIVAGDALAFYLYKLVWPAHLTLDYGRMPDVLMSWTLRWWTWLVPVVLAGAIWLFARRIRWLVAGGLMMLICLLPVIGLATFDFQFYSTVADHYLYLAMIGPALITAALLSRAWRPGYVGLACAILLVLAVRTHAQTRYWRNSETLFQRNASLTPRSFAAIQNLGNYYDLRGRQYAALAATYGQMQKGYQTNDPAARQSDDLLAIGRFQDLARQDWERALHYTREALTIHPYWAQSHFQMAEVLASLGEYDAAMHHVRVVVQLKVLYSAQTQKEMQSPLLTSALDAHLRGDDREALRLFVEEYKKNPRNTVALHAMHVLTKKLAQASRTSPNP